MTVGTILIVLLVAGVLSLVIKKAPFVDEPYRATAVWVVLAVAALIIIAGVAGLDIFDYPVGRGRR